MYLAPMRTVLRAFTFLLAAVVIIYVLGPKPGKPHLPVELPAIDVAVDDLDAWLVNREMTIEDLKPDNQSRMVWADSIPRKTDYSIVYLHGFSASPMEGDPVHFKLAERFGANLYLHRLVDHGVEGDMAFIDLTPERMMASALEALAIGRLAGDSVILMSCSTGGTLSLNLAAAHEDVHSLLLYSPNIDFADASSDMLIRPWGLQLARLMFRGKHRSLHDWPQMRPYWTMRYRLEGLVNLKSLVHHTMNKETFEKVDQPVMLMYYYRSEAAQDGIVSVKAMRKMYMELATPEHRKRDLPMADVASHVILSDLMSADVESVLEESIAFCEEVLGMKPL